MNSVLSYVCRQGNSSAYMHAYCRAFGSDVFDLSLQITTTLEIHIAKENQLKRWSYQIHICVERTK